jgi:hypothetical protein
MYIQPAHLFIGSVTEGDIAPEKPVTGGSKMRIRKYYNNGIQISERITEWGFNEVGEWVILKDVERSVGFPN